MNFGEFFHKIAIGFVRVFEKSIPTISEIKHHGNDGELCFLHRLQKALPNCQVKNNIAVYTNEGNTEIDFLILYNDNLFAIEVKNWKGKLLCTANGVTQFKRDIWTNEIHEKQLKSPFKQLQRSIYLLKKEIHENAWIHPIVFFNDEQFEGIENCDEEIWFYDIENLVNYVTTLKGKNTNSNNAKFLASVFRPINFLRNSPAKYFPVK